MQLELMGGDVFSLLPSVDNGPQSLIARRVRRRVPFLSKVARH